MRTLDGSWKLEREATEEFDARIHTVEILRLTVCEETDEIKNGVLYSAKFSASRLLQAHNALFGS